jgi:enoyl-CoA hydratase/carnithine racemase
MGLVNRVVAAEALDAEVAQLADLIASKSALTVSIGKKAFYEQLEKPLADAYAYASEVMVTNMLARDAEEGIGAFIEKRDPKWEDR